MTLRRRPGPDRAPEAGRHPGPASGRARRPARSPLPSPALRFRTGGRANGTPPQPRGPGPPRIPADGPVRPHRIRARAVQTPRTPTDTRGPREPPQLPTGPHGPARAGRAPGRAGPAPLPGPAQAEFNSWQKYELALPGLLVPGWFRCSPHQGGTYGGRVERKKERGPDP
ncbi:hypothetical protein STXM2123_5748 [Streptomyces sp. F-3]|nr:hypothetical protein STXM2123_5748 [Streptomyces sp. F-3]